MPIFHVDKKFHIDDTFPVRLIDFKTKADLYEKRPPYQRKNVWLKPKQKKLIDSIFRDYFIPRIILREVKVAEGSHKYEVVDGQQRIQAVQDFLNDEFKTPEKLSEIRADMSFDESDYKSQESNPDRHKFFTIINLDNNRLQHLQLLARLLIIEFNSYLPELSEKEISGFIERYESISSEDFERKTEVCKCIKILNRFYEIFKGDLIVKGDDKVKELDSEYLIISFYLLLRHLEKYYAYDKNGFQKFLHGFYQEWSNKRNDDKDMLLFRENSQQHKENLEERDSILRSKFFSLNPDIKLKASQRLFNEAERIKIYRDGKGICTECKREGKSDDESLIKWHDFEADHIIRWIDGGETTFENARLLCRSHNRSLNR